MGQWGDDGVADSPNPDFCLFEKRANEIQRELDGEGRSQKGRSHADFQPACVTRRSPSADAARFILSRVA